MSEIAFVFKIEENMAGFCTRVGDCPNVELSTKGGNLFWEKGYLSPRKIQVSTSFNLQDITVSTARPFCGKKGKMYSPKETVERARSRLGEENYSLLSNNCEHFAIWCKTGVSRSYQVRRAAELLGSGRREVRYP